MAIIPFPSAIAGTIDVPKERKKRSWWTWVGIAGVLVGLGIMQMSSLFKMRSAHTTFQGGVEKWCSDNPTLCRGSEPMADEIIDTVVTQNFNFPQSPIETELSGARSGTNGIGIGTGHNATIVAAPAGWGGAQTVLNHSGFIRIKNTIMDTGDLALTEGTKHWGFRYVKQVSDDWSNSGNPGGRCLPCSGCPRSKLFEFNWGTLNNTQLEERSDGPCGAIIDEDYNPLNFVIDGPWAGDPGNHQLSPAIRWGDCKVRPCVIEVWLDAISPNGSLLTGVDVRVRARVTSLDSGLVGSMESTTRSVSGGPTPGQTSGGLLFHNAGDGGNIVTGTEWVAFWLEMGLPEGVGNEDYWVGVPCELEGTC